MTAVVKLFLKKPDQAQGLVQKVLQTATAECDNPDTRDRAYVYWRLLSSDPQIAKVRPSPFPFPPSLFSPLSPLPTTITNHLPQQNVVLAQRPPITSTITTLPTPLLDTLLPHLSTLASVYHKPPSAFLGHGRSSANALQEAAIEEAAENARENPIAAAAAVAAGGAGAGGGAENLLDIDFDGAAPAAVMSPQVTGAAGGAGGGGGMEDLMGVFGGGDGASRSTGGSGAGNGGLGGADDLMNGFAGLDMSASASTQPPPASAQLANGEAGKKTNEDLLGLF